LIKSLVGGSADESLAATTTESGPHTVEVATVGGQCGEGSKEGLEGGSGFVSGLMSFHSNSATEASEQAPSNQPQDCDSDIEFDVVLEWLERQCTANDRQTANKPIPCTVFHGQRVPDITYRGYLERVLTFSGCSPACLIVAVSYLERVGELEPDMRVTSINMHRLLLTATMVACKLFDETFYCNAYWARVGGVPSSEMNKLELEFLFMIKFDLHRTKEQYDRLFHRLISEAWEGGSGDLSAKWASMPSLADSDAGEASPTNVVGNGVADGADKWLRKAMEGARNALNARACADASVTGASEALQHPPLGAQVA